MCIVRTTKYHLVVVGAILFSTISNQCMHNVSCIHVHDYHLQCCRDMTSNAVTYPASDDEAVTTKTTTHNSAVRKTNYSFQVNSTISCGRQMLDNNKIFGGSDTKVGEFPWIAAVFYSKYNHNECAGSVIQRKYILTAAHCLVGRILYLMGKPYKVRLGEHDLTTDPYCGSNKSCASNAIDMHVSNTFPHPKYQTNAKSSFDIGLIKLTDEIVYNDFIQPICYNLGVKGDFGDWFHVVGWGKTEKAEKSDRLLKAVIPYLNITRCQQVYNAINVRDDQICAGGEEGIDSCVGDSGGPLMEQENNVWSVVGIVSRGHTLCGTYNYPALYTRIDMHLKWLERKMLSG